MSVIQNQGIKFVNQVFQGIISKIAIGGGTAMSHISFYRSLSNIEEIINNVDKAINGQYHLIEDTGVSNNLGVAFIEPAGIEFYDDDVQNVVETCSLQVFKELLIAWRDFILTPPFDGSKA